MDTTITFAYCITQAAGMLSLAQDTEDIGRMAEVRALAEAWTALATALAADAS